MQSSVVFVVWDVETFVGVFDDVLQERAKLEADRKKAELARMEAERKVCCPISLIAPSVQAPCLLLASVSLLSCCLRTICELCF